MNHIVARQRIIIALAVFVAIVSAFTLAWGIQDSRVIHAENELSKVERKQNREAIEALARRVDAVERDLRERKRP